MGLFDKLFGKKEPLPEPVKTPEMPKVKKPRKPKEKKPEVELTAKEKATQAGEPYINVLSMEIDPTNLQNGAFELDWNEIFVARLVKAGYMMDKEDKDSDIVDRWFHQVCRNIVLEMYEQQQADPTNRDLREVNTRNLGNGRTEVS
jgi:hypothetical protein